MSDDPVRLCDDARATPALRRALARAALASPAVYDVGKGLARLDATLHAGVAVPSASNARAYVWGLVVVGVACVLVALGGALRSHAPAPRAVAHAAAAARGDGAAAPAVVTTATGATGATATLASSGERVAAGAISDAGVAARESRDAHDARVARSERAVVRAGHGSPAAAAPDLLDREHRQLEWAYAELARNPARALAVAADGHREFPAGRYYAEREVVAIRALVRLGRHDAARARARRFLAQHPTGTLGDFVRRLVSGGAPEAAP